MTVPILRRETQHPIELQLNGRPRSGLARPRLLLSDFLRHELGATGTHVPVARGDHREFGGDGIERRKVRRRLDAAHRIEHHPDRVASPEHGCRRVLVEGEDKADGIAQDIDEGRNGFRGLAL